MPYTPDEILDPSIVNELLEVGDAEFLQDLFETYIEDAHEKIDGITQAMTTGDAQQLGRLAHTFKGASGNIGAIQLSHIAEQLQQMGYNNNLDGVEKVVNELKELYKLVEITMKNKLQELQ
jgi:HPt (histidine-containing phosphotransfer) domain-containing protein